MRVEIAVYKGKNLWFNALQVCEDYNLTFSQRLEQCILDFCQNYNVGLPIWMSANTKEFAAFHQTTFTAEHFLEQPNFDYLVIRYLGD